MPKKSKKIRDLQVLKAQNDSNTAFDENHLDEAIEVRIYATTFGSEIVASNFGASLAILDEMFSTLGPNLDATIKESKGFKYPGLNSANSYLFTFV